jgi:hypothetical protein
MRDYWLSKLFYDLQDPGVAAQYREDREKVFARYRLEPQVKQAILDNDVPYLARRTNAYLLRFYFFGLGMKDEELIRRLRRG